MSSRTGIRGAPAARSPTRAQGQGQMAQVAPPASLAPRKSELPTRTSPPQQPTYRVLTLAPTPFFADYGCHVRILEETLALRRHGHEVLICTYPAGRDLEGVPVARSLGLPGGMTVRVGSSRHKIYLDALLSAHAMRTAVSFRPDVVHGHLHEGALIGYPVSRAMRCPLVFD